jgi:RsiW-degrading membrane proteinase PrsW (M82 family)
MDKKILKRELEVAFSKNSQPVWFRLLKYIILAAVLYFFWDTNSMWVILVGMLVFSLVVHFWYRFKTKGWTQSYGLWKHENEKKT